MTGLPISSPKFDCSITHACLSVLLRITTHWAHLPAPSDKLIATQYYFPGPGPDIIEFPLPQTNHSRQTPSAFLAQNTSLSIPERMASKLVDHKQGLGIPTEFLVWPQEARKWIQNESPQCSMSWALKKRTNSVLPCKDTWSCAFIACCWQSQSASIGHSKINSSKGISLP